MTAPLPNRVRVSLRREAFALDVDLELPSRGITVIHGPSGSGKTTLLRAVAGLERTGAGRVVVAGETWQDDAAGVFVPTWRRALGYVFQEASLFEHLDVRGNLEFGLHRSAAGQGAGALDGAVLLLGIGHLLRRMPAQLSGGERQRVAIARALATQPRLLLLDEPLAAIDRARRHEILPWLERLRDEQRTPMLYVTHSVDELARLADHVVALEAGHVRASGRLEEVLTRIDDPVFGGDEAGTVLEGQVLEREENWHLVKVVFKGGSFWLRDTGLPLGRAVRLRILASDVSLAVEEPRATSIQNLFACTIEGLAADQHPSQVLVRLDLGHSLLLARVTRRAVDSLGLRVGVPAWAQVKSVAVVE